MKRLATIACLWVCTAQAQPLPQPQAQPFTLAEREAAIHQAMARVNDALASIDSRFQAAARECWQKFAVNDCQTQVRRVRRAEREPWLIQQQALQAQERELRLAQREQRLQQKEGAP